MKLRLIVLTLLLLINSNQMFAAFPIRTVIAQNVAPISGQIISGSQISADTIYKKSEDRYKNHKHYHNREKEAKMSLTFGILGLLVFAPFGIPALILGIIAADRRNKYFERAKWGLIMGAISTLEILLIIVLIASLAI